MTSTLPTDFWGRVIYILQNYSASLGRGVLNTMIIAVLATLAGCIIGLAVGIVQTIPTDRKQSPVRWALLSAVKFILSAYVEIFRGTPMMVQLLIMSMVIFANSRNFTMVGALALGINSGAYVSEIIRGGLMAVDPGQMEAGRSLGLSYGQVMLRIIMPQAVKNILPTLINEFIALVKETAVAGYVAVQDLTRAGNLIRNNTYDSFNPLMLVAVVYLVLVIGMTQLLGLLERRLRRSDKR